MAIDANFINSLPDNKLLAEQKIIDIFYRTLEVYSMTDDKSPFYEDFLEVYSFYQVYAEKNTLDVSFPKLGTNSDSNLDLIISFFRNRHRIISKKAQKFANEKIIDDKKNKFKSLMFDDYFYKISQEELKQLKFLIHDIKSIVLNATYLEKSYIHRFIKKLDKILSLLQLELDSIDNLWGLAGETGIILAKAGEQAKDLISKIKAIVNITWEIQARAENLTDNKPNMILKYKINEKNNKKNKEKE